MITIYKYQFEFAPEFEIEMPENAKVLDVQMHHINDDERRPTMWALVDTEKPMVKRKFRAFWTGEKLSGIYLTWTHIATVQDVYVWHIFE